MTQSQEYLNRLVRNDSSQLRELETVTSPGARQNAWAVVVKSQKQFNVYTVAIVLLNQSGAMPTELGGELEAANLAEPFWLDGQLAAGTYAVMFRIADKYVFCR
jgi:hypothetical protein